MYISYNKNNDELFRKSTKLVRTSELSIEKKRKKKIENQLEDGGGYWLDPVHEGGGKSEPSP